MRGVWQWTEQCMCGGRGGSEDERVLCGGRRVPPKLQVNERLRDSFVYGNVLCYKLN